MNKVLVNVSFSIALIVGLLGCGGQKSQELTYEGAKMAAEKVILKFETIMKPIKAMERGDLSAMPKDLESLEMLKKYSNVESIKSLSNEISKAMQLVYKLKPEDASEDYNQWNQKMKQKLESIK